ncbi:DUF2474 domain-containing protein [Luteimonas viscosa]|uniref:DUF2474 domain-containing protein n=1 Tax=Luteimonas viscosa TaxID=1132694 RepID=A0A5D4XNU7_9GAMM|nr:DUF2474 domain-containing protein [Luteimonas viscosa]TYT26348.1 DUF2474 domain-containing protein [Luteimonas viscosa]
MRGPTQTQPGPLWKRLAWFVALWLGGLASVGLVAWLLRLWLLG